MTINADNPDGTEAPEMDGSPEVTDEVTDEPGNAEVLAPEATAAELSEEMSDAAPEDVEALVRAGKYEDAARMATRAGDHERAASLYERIWQFAMAAESARMAGDLARALRNAIDARDDERIHALMEEMAADEAGSRQAMEIFAHKRRFARAGALAESLGELERAVEFFQSAHMELDAARLLEDIGRDREAGRVLERFLELGPPGEERARAQLALGLILERRMNHQAAARHLQDAARHETTRARAQRGLVVALAAMGLRDAARDVLVSARADEPGLPADIDEFVRAQREALRIEREERGRTAGATGANREERVVGGRYRLIDAIGAGGAGQVFQARDEVSDRPCAVKIFHTSASRGNQSYERFVREARLASTLRHPNLVEVYDFSADQGYLVMELMTGSLEEKLAAENAVSARAVKRLALDVLAGLELAHQRGVIHRDIKPANIFFDARGTAKLGDFGVAHLLDLGQTQTGGLIGTLAYMAPEQITGAPLTITADLYALGITLFRALTGQLPFLGPDFVAQHLGEPPPHPSHTRPTVSADWDGPLLRLLAKNPSERHTSIDELRGELMSLELGDDARPSVLVLPRTSARHESDESPAATASATRRARVSASMSAQMGAVDDEDADEPSDEARYRFETPLGKTEISFISRAVDTILERSVIIERYREAGMDATTERRFLALARGGGPFLQRALAYERSAGVAVFEAPSGAPMSEAFANRIPSRRGAARLLKRLARALAPLHESSNSHGSLNPSTVLVDEELNPTVLVCGLGPARAETRPSDDVRAALELVCDALDRPIGDRSVASHLAEVLVPEMDHATRQEIARVPAPRTGEELYALVDIVEIALLRAHLGVAPGTGADRRDG